MRAIVFCLSLVGFALPSIAAEPGGKLVFCCAADNDLFRTLTDMGWNLARFEQPMQAVRAAPDGGGVLILADKYPKEATPIEPAVYEEAAKKKLRLYVEYPTFVPELELGKIRTLEKGEYHSVKERSVVTSDAFGPALQKMRIVMIHDCHYLPVKAEKPHLVVAQVSGYDSAKYGLPEKTSPLLFEHPRGNVMVAATKLSHFVTGRYAPTEAWGPIWQMILGWLNNSDQKGESTPELKWTRTVRPMYERTQPLAADAQREAVRRGVEWFQKSKLFIEPSGKKGFHEGYNSKTIFFDGRQDISTQVRGDCSGEVAMTLALGGNLLGDKSQFEVATNLNDLLYFESIAARGPRLDPKSPTYGLIGGDLLVDSGIYYADDSCRHLLGSVASAVLMKSDRWDERMLMEMLANLRTTGPNGFRQNSLMETELQQAGWQNFWTNNRTSPMPHFQAYMWATYLWLYDKTKFEPLLQRAREGIRNQMALYPDKWGHEANRYETERCRMLLPLAWLIRVDDRPEHRVWLKQITQYVLGMQHACGTIPQFVVQETKSNGVYGTAECALVQSNGDPATDLLYAVNYAFIGLHEAAAATGDPELKQAEDRMADFLIRVQIRSTAHPELDGAWFRCFDFAKWDYWGSDGDAGWGVWTIETGWTQTWIISTLALREMKTSYWELTANSPIAKYMAEVRPKMLPDSALSTAKPAALSHQAIFKPVDLAEKPHQAFSAGGAALLTDGKSPAHAGIRQGCMGYEGQDFVATVDLGASTKIASLGVSALQDVAGGIFLPTTVEFEVSTDGRNFDRVAEAAPHVSQKTPGPLGQIIAAEGLHAEGRYVRVHAKSVGAIPDWHPSAGRPAWLLVDELLVNAKQGQP